MTLTETVFWSKIASKVAIGVVVLLIGGYYGYLYYVTITRPPEAVFRPDYKCGTLPKLEIVAQEGVAFGSANIVVEAVKSSLPSVPLITYVYKIDITGETFQTRDSAFALAENLGFKRENYNKVPGSTTYTWTDVRKGASLQIDTATLNFSFTHTDAKLPAVPNTSLPSTLFRAPESAQTFLSSIGRFTSEFSRGKSFAYAVKLAGGVTTGVSSIDAAQLIRVDYQKVTPLLGYSKAITLPTYSGPTTINFESYYEQAKPGSEPDPNFIAITARRVGQTPITANVQVYMSSQSGDAKNSVHQLIYNNWKIEDGPCGTYPILRPADAIDEISRGGGSIVFLRVLGGDPFAPAPKTPMKEIRLYQLELNYYEANTVQAFLQPIYVATGEVTFEDGGKGEIAVYIPAIDYDALAGLKK